MEEDESKASSSRSPSPLADVKAKRRRANISDIRIARDVPVHDDNDFSPLDDNFLSAPRPAPRPSPSPEGSPDSFKLTFTELSSKFPKPPVPSSPTRSVSSLSSSPCSQSGGLPLTPSTSDDEFSSSSRTFNPRRAAIQPLVIHKHNPRATSPYDEISVSPSLLQPFKNSSENINEAPLSPLSSSFLGDDSASDSEPESDSEWYTREFSKIISLRSPLPPSFPQHHSRPDSVSISSDFVISSPPGSRRRVSQVLPSTPSPTKRESALLDTTFPRRRNSKTRSIPNYPPPPVPTIPAHLRSPSTSTSSLPSSPFPASPRPPPRFSVPDDCVFDLYMDSEDGSVGSDTSSAFSFTMYEVNFEDSQQAQPSPVSAYSQPSFDEQNFPVELDYQLMLPLSLPNTPIDLEADIAQGLQRLRSREEQAIFEEAEFVIEEEVEEPVQEEQTPVEEPIAPASSESSHESVNDLFSPTCSSFSFSPSPSPSNSFYQQQYAYYPNSPSPSPYANEEKMLKSKWSTSTLGSIREEHERRGASSKLKLYFGSPNKATKRASGSTKSAGNLKVPPTPTSPFGLISPRKSSRTNTNTSPSPARNHQHQTYHTHKRGSSSNSNSDVLVIGYGANGVGVRRRGSLATVSDAGSEGSASSSSSSGLRRKPIPVEMFLRSAV